MFFSQTFLLSKHNNQLQKQKNLCNHTFLDINQSHIFPRLLKNYPNNSFSIEICKALLKFVRYVI